MIGFLRRLSWLVSLSIVGCSSTPSAQCQSSSVCNLFGQGICAPAEDGHSWCQYPDVGCPSGYRWSTQAGDGLAGICALVAPGDAGLVDVDASLVDGAAPDAR